MIGRFMTVLSVLKRGANLLRHQPAHHLARNTNKLNSKLHNIQSHRGSSEGYRSAGADHDYIGPIEEVHSRRLIVVEASQASIARQVKKLRCEVDRSGAVTTTASYEQCADQPLKRSPSYMNLYQFFKNHDAFVDADKLKKSSQNKIICELDKYEKNGEPNLRKLVLNLRLNEDIDKHNEELERHTALSPHG